MKSKETQRTYLTARTAKVACTFNELTCETLIGTELPSPSKFVKVNVTVQSLGILAVVVPENVFGLIPPINGLSLFFVF